MRRSCCSAACGQIVGNGGSGNEGLDNVRRGFRWLAIFCISGALGGQTMQLAQDQAAFGRARAVAEPVARLAALKQFSAEYPGAPLARRAAALELETLLRSFPERAADIQALAAAALASTSAGLEHWTEQARLASLLANAGPDGADLSDARPWADEAVAALTEESYRRQMRALEARYRLPAMTAPERRRAYAQTRASFLTAQANVALRLKDMDKASGALAEAGRLQPLSSAVSSGQGQLALQRGQNREALQAFERAEAEGDLPEPWRGAMVRLYAELHRPENSQAPAADSGTAISMAPSRSPELDDEIDALYGELFPPLFQLPTRTLAPGGHTVLLELFTGAGCEPCIAPDLAMESLLSSYRRQDLVVLEYDEHIPRPDPLANPDSVARAAAYHVGTTPQVFLDGENVPLGGAARSDVENVVVGLADEIEDRAADPASLDLGLQVSRGPDGTIGVQAIVSPRPRIPGNGTPVAPVATVASRAVLRFALVEDRVRYSGENGIRFHRMVVRALTRGTAIAKPAISVSASFRPATLAGDQRAYLDAFERNNDRFGEVRFLTKQIPLRADHLAVVAWVEDASTGAVLQTAYVAVGAE